MISNLFIVVGVILGLIALFIGLLMWIGVAIMHMDSIDHAVMTDGDKDERKASRK